MRKPVMLLLPPVFLLPRMVMNRIIPEKGEKRAQGNNLYIDQIICRDSQTHFFPNSELLTNSRK
jgi:hypothetical protein